MEIEQLINAYRRTSYIVIAGSEHYQLRVGDNCEEFDLYLRAMNENRWALITANNPGSTILPESENRLRNESLAQRLKMLGYKTIKSTAIADDRNWPDEKGFLVFGISVADATALAQEFLQVAILTGEIGEPVELAMLTQNY